MIQRIQTLYLIIAEVLVALLFFFPLAEIAGKDGSIYRFDLKGIYLDGSSNIEPVSGSLPVVLLASLILLLLFVTILQYKNRVRQIRLSTLNVILLIGLFGLIFFYTYKSAELIDGTYSLSIFSSFPIIAAVLVYLAIRGIAKDELLVRSVDRIR